MKANLAQKTVRRLPLFSLILSLICLLTLCCFLFPEYLTTPQLRSKYPIPLFRELIYWSIVLSSLAAFLGLLFSPMKRISALSLAMIGLILVLGGSQVPLKDEYQSFSIQIGLDWFLLDLFILAVIFVPLEAFFPKYKDQPLVRSELKVDLTYFLIGHIGFQLIALLTQSPAHRWLEFLRLNDQTRVLADLPLVIQILLALFVADLVQYWIHRAFHQSKSLWEFHKIHHSIKKLDWLAGSRIHLLDIVIMRTLVYIVVMYLGLSPEGFTGYVFVMAAQTVFIHANIAFEFGFLNYLFTTPQYHHWHHHDRPETYDKNFAVHFPVLDMIFGTFYLPKHQWPGIYGVDETDYPASYLGQFLQPFKDILNKNLNTLSLNPRKKKRGTPS